MEAEFRLAGTPDDASDLVITELNYHPHDPTSWEQSLNAGWTSNYFEFVELANGAEMVFPAGTSVGAGEVLVVVCFDPADAR